MKITEIVFSLTPSFKPDIIELHCRLEIDGKVIQYKRVFPETDFESRAERYFNYMRDEIIKKIEED